MKRLVLFSALAGVILFSSMIQAETVLFLDDFESGHPSHWVLDPGWEVLNDAGNFVLSGRNHSFARTGDRNWRNYSFQAKVKLKAGHSAVHLNYRVVCERYFIGFTPTSLYLNKTKPCGTHTTLVNLSDPHAIDRWYAVEIVGKEGNIKVYVDGTLKIDRTDTNPVLSGPISFETLSSGAVYIDDVLVSTDESLSASRWESTGGPLGGLGYDVRIDPTNKMKMYVTDNYAGVAKSETGGQHWTLKNEGISVRSGPTGDAVNIFSLTIDPNNPEIIWAGTFGEGSAFGVFKSTDGGRSWGIKNSGISLEGYPGLVFRGFTIQEGDSRVVYAQAEVTTTRQGLEFNLTKGRVYKTTDGGDSWTKIYEGDNLCRYLIIHPSNPNILYLSTGIFDREAYNSDCRNGFSGGVGVFKSLNGGQTWSQVNNGLTDLYIGSLRMHPGNPEILFAATGNNACSGQYTGNVVSGLFRTTNGGATWSKVIDKDIMTAVNFSPSNPNVVYAGSSAAFYRSEDGGITWQRYSKQLFAGYGPQGIKAGFPIDVVVDPDDPSLLYVNNYGGGVFRSDDGAETWTAWSTGYTGAEIHRVFIPADRPEKVCAIGRSGPFSGSDFGRTWNGIANGDAAIFGEWYDIVSQPGNGSTILLTDEHQGVILRSADSGDLFQEVLRHPSANPSNPDLRQGFKSIVFSLSSPDVVYAGLARDRLTVLTSSPVGTALYKSTDAGRNFFPMPSILEGGNVNRLIVSPSDSNVVYAATSRGVYKTTNGAASWVKLSSLGTRHIQGLAVDFREPDFIIAGEVFGGIWISGNGGSSWSGPHNSGFNSPNPYITVLALDPRSSTTVFAGDLYSGIYRSTDGGFTWSPFPDWKMSGLTTRAVTDLHLNGLVLYAATQGGGVFRFYFGGDINDDGTVNLMDVILVLQIVSGIAPSGTIKPFAVNEDNKIGLEEAIFLLQKMANVR
jgi:photosystem II stability/assembly factor-like uncharacterized protein